MPYLLYLYLHFALDEIIKIDIQDSNVVQKALISTRTVTKMNKRTTKPWFLYDRSSR